MLVIGAGMAGSVAAARAAQLGRRVLLADAAAEASSGGSTAWSGGSIHINRLPLTSPLTAIRQRVDFRTAWRGRISCRRWSATPGGHWHGCCGRA